MKIKLKLGEYIRTKNGLIDKVLEIKTEYTRMNGNNDIVLRLSDKKNYWFSIKNIVKPSSKNIIDLVQVGDVIEILSNEINNFTILVEILGDEQIEALKLVNIKYIKSIVTKEQIESVKYKVEEE